MSRPHSPSNYHVRLRVLPRGASLPVGPGTRVEVKRERYTRHCTPRFSTKFAWRSLRSRLFLRFEDPIRNATLLGPVSRFSSRGSRGWGRVPFPVVTDTRLDDRRLKTVCKYDQSFVGERVPKTHREGKGSKGDGS